MQGFQIHTSHAKAAFAFSPRLFDFRFERMLTKLLSDDDLHWSWFTVTSYRRRSTAIYLIDYLPHPADAPRQPRLRN